MSISESEGSLNFFCDESDLDVKELEIGMMVIGGYYIPKAEMLKLDEEVVNVKSDNNLDKRDPIKWSMPYKYYKDTLDKINKSGGIEKLKIDMLSIVKEITNIKLVMVGLYKWRPELRDITWQRGFEWILQRLSRILEQKLSGLKKEAHYPFLDVVCDWFPSESKRKVFFKVYQNAYIDGFPKLIPEKRPPSLMALKACPCLVFADSDFSLALQLTDFLVGATRRFILWCFSDEPERYIEDVRKYFSIIFNAFRSHPRMGVVGYGLTAPNESSRKRLRDKLRELKKLKVI